MIFRLANHKCCYIILKLFCPIRKQDPHVDHQFHRYRSYQIDHLPRCISQVV